MDKNTRKTALKKPDTVIENIGKAIDKESLRGILDLIEEAHKTKYDFEDRAQYIREKLKYSFEPHWQVVIADCDYGSRCTATSSQYIHVSIGKCNYHLWRTALK